MDYEELCGSLGKTLKVKISEKEREKLGQSIDFLDIKATPEETQGLAMALGLSGAIIGIAVIAALSVTAGFSALWMLFAGFPALLFFYLKRYPVLKAESEKRKAAAQMPAVMSYMIMSLRISPNVEKAVEFSARHSSGLFRTRLEGILFNIRTGRGDAEAGLLGLAGDFKKWDEFGRCMQLVMASGLERTEDRRQATLDKAAEVLLAGLAQRTEREARALNTPVMIVFTFGVILPLIFIAIIPFMSLMGMQVGEATVAILYVVGLPIMLYALVRFVASSRPMTIIAPRVPGEKRLFIAALVGATAGAASGAAVVLGKGTLGSLEYVPMLWASAAGIGVFLLVSTLKTVKLRKRVKETERGFAENLHQLGVLLSEGRPFEDAMQRSDSQFFRSTAGSIRKLNTNISGAFFDSRFGSLREVYSDTIRSAAEILASISDKGSDALASVSFRIAEHIGNLKKTEFEIERTLGGVVSSMRIIALFVAPIVGGMISSMSIVLAETMAKSQGGKIGFAGNAAPLDPSLVTLIIGAYAVESAAILTIFGTDLMNGDDKVMKKRAVGITLVISTVVFTACAWFAGGLFGGLA